MQRVLLGAEATEPLLKGVNAVCDAVKVTAGPRGRTVIISGDYGCGITKDGVTVAKAVEVDDEIEMIGAQLMKEVAHTTLKEGGDGTTTAIILAQAMIKNGMDEMAKLGKEVNVVELKRGMDDVVTKVVQFIKDKSIAIEDNMKLLRHVAVISANGDEEIGELIFKAYSKIGKEGILHVDESNSVETYVKEINGVQFDRGYLSPEFINDPSKMRVSFKAPYILVCDFAVNKIDDIVEALNKSAKNATAFVLLAPDISGDALTGLVINKKRGAVNCVAIKAPFSGEKQTDFLQDVCNLTGAVMVSEASGGFKNQNAALSMGKCDSISVTNDKTTIGKDNAQADQVSVNRINDWVAGLEVQMEEQELPEQKKYYKERIARLNGNINILYVGGVTPTAMKEKSDRIDDAVQAVRCAIAEGVVPGGATMYLRAIDSVTAAMGQQHSKSYHAGEQVILKALEAPFNQLCENSGVEQGSVPRATLLKGQVYNFKDFTWVKPGDNTILDPAKVERIALENAASIAAVLLQTSVVVNARTVRSAAE